MSWTAGKFLVFWPGAFQLLDFVQEQHWVSVAEQPELTSVHLLKRRQTFEDHLALNLLRITTLLVCVYADHVAYLMQKGLQVVRGLKY